MHSENKEFVYYIAELAIPLKVGNFNLTGKAFFEDNGRRSFQQLCCSMFDCF